MAYIEDGVNGKWNSCVWLLLLSLSVVALYNGGKVVEGGLVLIFWMFEGSWGGADVSVLFAAAALCLSVSLLVTWILV